jgi:redox-sensitive bicupin YhaK (pirin superfamily)
MTNLLSKTAVIHRPSNERFHSRLNWLDSRHTFSFSNHFDPAWTGFGPLLVINDDTIAAGEGFGMHPHRDMEIITVMVEGQINHQDSMGHAEVLRAGEVQRMSAGTGIVHSEMNRGQSPCRLLQIWIAPVHKGLEPSYEQRHIDVGKAWTPLLNPDPSQGAMAIDRPVRLWRAQPKQGQELILPAESGDTLWLQLINGSVQLEGIDGDAPDALQCGDGLGLRNQRNWTLTSQTDDADLLLFSLA